MKVDVVIPGVGESITEGTLASWSVADGAPVIEGQALFEMETDKTTIDVTAPATGRLTIVVPEGTDVVIDQVVGSIDTDRNTAGSDTEGASSETRPSESKAPAGDESRPSGRITPAAKAAAEAEGIELSGISGTGRNGMITKGDILAAVGPATAEGNRPESESTEPPGAPDGSEALKDTGGDFPEERQSPAPVGETRKPLSRIRKVIAANLARTRDELVLLTTFNEADMSAIKGMRSRFGAAFAERYGVKLGFMSFFLKASAAALQAFPEVNARIEGEDVVYPDGVHISVAVSTPRGLVTPVVRHAEEKGFADIEKEIIGFSRMAEEKTLLPVHLSGGSFTITNGGIFGSMMSTPLPAPKQSAILGMHAITDRPVVVDGEIVIRPMMYLALSYDHRLVDGREAVGCLKTIKEALEHPERLLLEL